MELEGDFYRREVRIYSAPRFCHGVFSVEVTCLERGRRPI